MPSRVPAVHYTEARHSSMCTSLSSTGVSWRLLMRYPSYARNRAYALPSPSPFHYVMAKIVPAVQLAAHAKSNTLYSRSYGRTSKFFRLDGLLLCRIIMGLRFARCELRYKGTKVVIITVPCKLFFPNCFFFTRIWIQLYSKGNSSCNEKLLYYNIRNWIGFRRAESRCCGSLYSILLFKKLYLIQIFYQYLSNKNDDTCPIFDTNLPA